MLDAKDARQLMTLAHRKVLLHDSERARKRRNNAAWATKYFVDSHVPRGMVTAPARLPTLRADEKIVREKVWEKLEADLDCAIGRAAATDLSALYLSIWFDPMPYARKRAVVKWILCVLRKLGYTAAGGFFGNWRNPQKADIYVAWDTWESEHKAGGRDDA